MKYLRFILETKQENELVGKQSEIIIVSIERAPLIGIGKKEKMKRKVMMQ